MYKKAILEIIEFKVEDIITTSSDPEVNQLPPEDDSIVADETS